LMIIYVDDALRPPAGPGIGKSTAQVASSAEMDRFFDGLDELSTELDTHKPTKKLATSTERLHEGAENLLRGFVNRYFAKKGLPGRDQDVLKPQDNDAIKGKDLRVVALAKNGRLTFKIVVTFRLLKGMRKDASKFRRSVLYSHPDAAPGLDPTVPILKILLEDQAFVGIDTQDDLLNLSPAHLATLEDGQLELPLRSEYSETCLFRAVRQASGSRSYVVSATRGLTYDRANRLRRAAAHCADFNDQEMVFYTLRRMVVSATNRTDVTSESAHLVVGHKLGTSTRF
ncbi:unnamed protein product, partial [Tilletia caries]